MKKIILILSSLMLVLSLCACGSDSAVVAGDGEVVAGKDAGNDAVDFSFLYPEGWELVRNDGTIDLQYDCDLSDGIADYASITVARFGLSDEQQGKSVTEYWADYQSELESELGASDFVTEIYDTADNYLDDSPAIKAKYNINKAERPYISEQIVCCRYEYVYFITLTVPSEHYETVSSALMTVKDSFAFEK